MNKVSCKTANPILSGYYTTNLGSLWYSVTEKNWFNEQERENMSTFIRIPEWWDKESWEHTKFFPNNLNRPMTK